MHTDNQNTEIKDEGDPQPGDFWIDEESGQTSPCYLPDATGKLVLVDFYGEPYDDLLDPDVGLDIKALTDDFFEEKRKSVPAIFDDDDVAQADYILSKYIKFMKDGTTPDEGRVTRAAEFLYVMVRYNYVFAEKLTHLLMTKHFRPTGGRPVDEMVLYRDYIDFRAGRAAKKTVDHLHTTLGKRHNVKGASMKKRIKKGQHIVERAEGIHRHQYSAMMMDQIPEPTGDGSDDLFPLRPIVRE